MLKIFYWRRSVPDYSGIDVYPKWKDTLEEGATENDTIQQRLEADLQADYEKRLLQALKGKNRKRKPKNQFGKKLRSSRKPIF